MVDVFLPGLLPFRSHFSLLDSEQKDRTQVIGSFFQKKTSMVYDKVQSTRGGHTKNFITVGAINHLAQSQLFLYGHICMYDYSLLSIYSTHDFQFPSHINRAREKICRSPLQICFWFRYSIHDLGSVEKVPSKLAPYAYQKTSMCTREECHGSQNVEKKHANQDHTGTKTKSLSRIWCLKNVNFVKNEILKMWILWKVRFWKGEFCEKWDFEKVNFVKSRIFKMWIFG